MAYTDPYSGQTRLSSWLGVICLFGTIAAGVFFGPIVLVVGLAVLVACILVVGISRI